MIRLTRIEIGGESGAGAFRGSLALTGGLQVVSAHNAYGKSLAVTAVAWCLGLEPMLGFPPNDVTCFPEAARERADFETRANVPILSSWCAISISHDDGRSLLLSRNIRGDVTAVDVVETTTDGKQRSSKLVPHRGTMQDEHGGLQRFLFEWLGWPREKVATFKGTLAEMYLENLAPSFYIEQDEGWTDMQALQISRYQQRQISESAVEYLLGALDALHVRVAKLQANSREIGLHEAARTIADRVSTFCVKNGWAVDWSGHGSLKEVVSRWSEQSVKDKLKQDARIDFPEQRATLELQVASLKRQLTSDPIDQSNASAPASASQLAIELKSRRHQLNSDLRTLRDQLTQTSELLSSIEHRIRASEDLLRFKESGVGRFDHLECPTCHRDIDPETFGLSDQTHDSIKAHIEALGRDRQLIRKTEESTAAALVATQAELQRVDHDLQEAERALVVVTDAVGTLREQMAQTVATLTAVERKADRLGRVVEEVNEFQSDIDRWIAEARLATQQSELVLGDPRRSGAFLKALGDYLFELGHSAVNAENTRQLAFDDRYLPLLQGRRLPALGSASDRARLVAAYALGLAEASTQVAGLHPGFVILDEPLQQNPDPKHRRLFIEFLSRRIAKQAKFQTLIFTSLTDDEIANLRRVGTTVTVPEGKHFLSLIPPDPKSPPRTADVKRDRL